MVGPRFCTGVWQTAEKTPFVPDRRRANFLVPERSGLVPGTGGSNNDTIAEFAEAALDKNPAGYDRVRHALHIAGLPE